MGLLKITEKEKVELELELYAATAMYPTEMWTLWKCVRGLGMVGWSTGGRAILSLFRIAAAYVLTLSAILYLVMGHITTLTATLELADGSYALFEQLKWYDATGADLKRFISKQEGMTRASLSTQILSRQNFTYNELIDNSMFRWKSPPIVCVPGPTYQ
jgi:hypothetical protein